MIQEIKIEDSMANLHPAVDPSSAKTKGKVFYVKRMKKLQDNGLQQKATDIQALYNKKMMSTDIFLEKASSF